jgi:hypothetical protein
MKSRKTPQEAAGEFLLPWEVVSDANATKLRQELALELSDDHPLLGMKLEAVARSVATDDVVFRLPDERFVQVHLTWIGKADCPPWPVHCVYANFAEWAEAVMLPEHDRYD